MESVGWFIGFLWGIVGLVAGLAHGRGAALGAAILFGPFSFFIFPPGKD